MVNKYIPKQGDILLINLNPKKGHEQSGIRPAVVKVERHDWSV